MDRVKAVEDTLKAKDFYRINHVCLVSSNEVST